MPESTFPAFEAHPEIRELESRAREIHEGRSAEAGAEQIRDSVHQAIGEALAPHISATQTTTTPQDVAGDDNVPEAERVRELVAYAYAHGLRAAVERARKTNNFHVLDKFHDTLT